MADEDSWLIDFPTLGHLVCAWIERHCRQPDGPLRGRPVVLSDWQYWLAANRWRIRVDAPYVPPEEVTVDNPMVLNQAFTYRMTLTVGPQKWGKGPCTAFFTAAEASGYQKGIIGMCSSLIKTFALQGGGEIQFACRRTAKMRNNTISWCTCKGFTGV